MSNRNSPRRAHTLTLRRLGKLFRSADRKNCCPLCGGELWQGSCLNCEGSAAEIQADLLPSVATVDPA